MSNTSTHRLTLEELYEIAYDRLSSRQRIFALAEEKISGNIENWVQWELIEALEDRGFKTSVKGKILKDCDIIVDHNIGIELRTSPSGNLLFLEKAFKHKTDFYVFTFLNRQLSDAKQIFEKRIFTYSDKFISGCINPQHVLLVAET
jgi:hypothetical protein